MVKLRHLLTCLALAGPMAAFAVDTPDCSRPFSLALHDHGLLYSAQTGEGIDRDITDEMIRRSGCRISVSVMARSRIWQLIESGAIDFSLSGITNLERDSYAAFAWYFSNKYYLLVRNGSRTTSPAAFQANPALRLGVIRSFRYGEAANRFVDQLAAQGRVSYSTTLDPLYKILLDNRVQGMIIEPFDYPAVENARIRNQTTILEFADRAVPHGLIMSRKSLSPAQQQAWRDVVDAMRADGTVQRIFEKYFKRDLALAMTRF